MYNLSNIPNFNNIISRNNENSENSENNKYIKVISITTKNNESYKLIKYDKTILNNDLIEVYGLLRSVILNKNNNIIGFSPVKSINSEIFINKYPILDDNIIAEEFVEGTMINVFYDDVIQGWKISTRNNIDAEVYFYKQENSKTKTFKIMFDEALKENNLNLNNLNKKYSYSFVLQHPDNIIVVPFNKPQLYCVGVYEIKLVDNNIIVYSFPFYLKDDTIWNNTTIKFPEIYNLKSYNELIDKYASINTPYHILGVVLKNITNGLRTKIRNPIYEEVRQLRGNQPKLQYQYLILRNQGKITDFLKFFPNNKKQFSVFREQIHFFTKNLHQNYIDCFVKHNNPLNSYSPQYKTHMFKLHEIYLNDLMKKKSYVSLNIVINYVNKLHPSLLMYSLNYNMRKRIINLAVCESETNINC